MFSGDVGVLRFKTGRGRDLHRVEGHVTEGRAAQGVDGRGIGAEGRSLDARRNTSFLGKHNRKNIL